MHPVSDVSDKLRLTTNASYGSGVQKLCVRNWQYVAYTCRDVTSLVGIYGGFYSGQFMFRQLTITSFQGYRLV